MKKVWIMIIGAVLLGAAGAGTYLLVSPAKSSIPKNTVTVQNTPTPKLMTWDDPAGFTFSYPDGVVINKHDEDTDNYAHVELSDPKHQGSLIVWAKDLPKGVTDTASWVKKDTTLSGAVALDTTLGGVGAKKLLVSVPFKRIVIGTVNDGLLFYIDTTLTDEPYWQGVVDTISGSFVFKPVETPAAKSDSSDTGGSADEEEVLE